MAVANQLRRPPCATMVDACERRREERFAYDFATAYNVKIADVRDVPTASRAGAHAKHFINGVRAVTRWQHDRCTTSKSPQHEMAKK